MESPYIDHGFSVHHTKSTLFDPPYLSRSEALRPFPDRPLCFIQTIPNGTDLACKKMASRPWLVHLDGGGDLVPNLSADMPPAAVGPLPVILRVVLASAAEHLQL